MAAASAGLFVTGTDTGVGKSIVAAAVIAALAVHGLRVAALKPVITGLDDPASEWGHDDDLLARVASAGQSRDDVAPARFGPPASPHLAAELAGVELRPDQLVAAANAAAAGSDALVVEGVGGLLVPLARGYLVRDLAAALGLPVAVVARPGLGTINHTLLTIEAARAAGIEPLAVVLTPWRPEAGTIEWSNRDTIERLTGVPVSVLPTTTPDGLAGAGAQLPVVERLAAAAGLRAAA